MAYQAYVLFLFLLILSAPCVCAYVSYHREMKGGESRPEPGEAVPPPLPEPAAAPNPAEPILLRPDRSRLTLTSPSLTAEQRAAAVASIVHEARRRFGR